MYLAPGKNRAAYQFLGNPPMCERPLASAGIFELLVPTPVNPRLKGALPAGSLTASTPASPCHVTPPISLVSVKSDQVERAARRHS